MCLMRIFLLSLQIRSKINFGLVTVVGIQLQLKVSVNFMRLWSIFILILFAVCGSVQT